MNISTTIDAAVKYYGSKSEIARVLNITRQSVNSWSNNGNKFIPEPSASHLYILTDGKLGTKITNI